MLLVLIVQKLITQHFDILFDLDQKLNLVLLDGASDSWPGQKSGEDLEDAEHLVRVLSLR